MASARVDEEIERDTIEEETLLRQEDKHKGVVIKNDNFQDQDVRSSTSTKSQPEGEKEKIEKTADNPAVKNQQDDQEDHKDYGLCRSGKCISHWACRDPLLYRTSVCDRLTDLLHTRRRYELCELSLKILTLTTILCCTSLVFYQFGLTKCELTKIPDKHAASRQMNDTNKSMATTKDNSVVTTKATTNVVSETLSDDENQDKEQDDDFKTSDEDHQREGQGFESGKYKEKTGKTTQTEQQNTDKDFMFDEEKNDSESIVISFWPK